MSPAVTQSFARPRPAEDVYSLGVVTYEMRSGRLPFSGTTEALLVKHTGMAPPPFKSRGAK